MANTLKISVENEDILTHSIINGIDTSNRIVSMDITSSNTWTATQDCIGWCQFGTDSTGRYFMSCAGAQVLGVFPIKKGQRIQWVSDYSSLHLNAYGIKR